MDRLEERMSSTEVKVNVLSRSTQFNGLELNMD